MNLAHVLLPCKMTSSRVHRKNLAPFGSSNILEWSIQRCHRWLPQATVWIATEDAEVQVIARREGCQIYSLSPCDLADQRNVSDLFTEFLSLRSAAERCLCLQLTSPFTFRSELERAVGDPRPYVRSAFMGTLHFVTGDRLANGWLKLSQDLEASMFLTGNFLCANGGHRLTPDQDRTCLCPVSLFSALDINTPTDLRICQMLASRLTFADLEACSI